MEDWKIYHEKFEKEEIYHIALYPRNNGVITEQTASLHEQYKAVLQALNLNNNNLVFTKIFVSDYVNCQQTISKEFIEHSDFQESAISIIEQPPLNGTKINLLLCFIKADDMQKEKHDGVFYMKLHGIEHIFQSIPVKVEKNSDLVELTTQAFNKHQLLLDSKQMNIADNCIRTWLYVRDIDNDYSDVVKGRNNYFFAHGLTTTTHFIASTGIGGSGAHPSHKLCTDFYSAKGLDAAKQIKYLSAKEYLNATSEYGVSFERGTRVAYPYSNWLFISGTASIDKYGKCLYHGDVIKQVERVLINIEQLLRDGNASMKDIAQMTVYLRDVSDYQIIYQFLNNHFKNVPFVITSARVCRPEWLIEIECIAIN